MLRILQKGFNYSQDGPGNRLVYHLQGCNLHCPWCSNPESIPLHGSLMLTDPGRLYDGCCPKGAVSGENLDRRLCEMCREHFCASVPGCGIKWTGQEIAADQIFDEILRSRAIFFDGGGVTFTGGEPTLQAEPLKRLLAKLKDSGIHTAMESNATTESFRELLPLLDYVILDVKHYCSAVFADTVGGGLSHVSENLSFLLASGKEALVRIPLIGGFNIHAGKEKEDAEGFAAFFAQAAEKSGACGGESPMAFFRKRLRVELLRYHEYGKDKWLQCGKEYRMDGEAQVSAEMYRAFSTVLADSYQITLVRT